MVSSQTFTFNLIMLQLSYFCFVTKHASTFFSPGRNTGFLGCDPRNFSASKVCQECGVPAMKLAFRHMSPTLHMSNARETGPETETLNTSFAGM